MMMKKHCCDELVIKIFIISVDDKVFFTLFNKNPFIFFFCKKKNLSTQYGQENRNFVFKFVGVGSC